MARVSRHPQQCRLTVLWLLTLSCVACGDATTEGGTSQATDESSADQTAVVAVIDDVPITSDRVARLAKETGRPPQEVLERLIDFELLAAEARRRGLSNDREVLQAARKAMIQAYLEDEFEATHRVTDIPEEVLQKGYKQNISRFKHPQLRKVGHILVVSNEKRESPSRRAAAHRLAGVIAREARKTMDIEGFEELARRYDSMEKFKIFYEEISSPVHEKARFARSFVDAAMKLETIGEVSPPVQTKFGSHVIYLIDIKEAVDRTFEEVRDEVAKNEHPFWLQSEFGELVEGLRLSGKVHGYQGKTRRSPRP